AVVLWQLGLLAIAACLPTTRLRASKRSRTRRVMSGAGVGVRVGIVALARLLMLSQASGVRSDFDLSLTGGRVVLLLVIVGLIVTGPTSNWAVRALGNVPMCRSVVAIAARHRTPATVRFVIVAAVTLATVFAVLGASVQARPDTQHLLDERLARLPVLPRNVALMRLNPVAQPTTPFQFSFPAFAPGFTGSDLNGVRVAIARAVPGAEIVELHSLGERVTSNAVAFAPDCNPCDFGPYIIADARLRDVYGGPARYSAPSTYQLLSSDVVGPDLSMIGVTRVPSEDAILQTFRDGGPLPAVSFADAVYYEVPAKSAVGLPTAVSGMFIRSPKPLTDAQLTRLAAVARAVRVTSQPQLTLIGPRGSLVPLGAQVAQVAVSASLRQAPWAATSAAARWTWAGVAALIALVTLLVTLTIDTIDRRRDVERLERIGATPHQVRSAAAVQTALLLTIVTWLSAVLVVGLVKVGIDSFNHAEPTIAVPFTMPWAVVLLLTLGLPAAGAGLAALLARPAWLESRSIENPGAALS
ncbi:MAG: FtsX-like permease family protein, partial [Acidimicrobiia bacterium]